MAELLPKVGQSTPASFDEYYSETDPNIKVVVMHARKEGDWNTITQYRLCNNGKVWAPYNRAFVLDKDIDSTVKGYLREE